jgi:hypothetical protein
LAYFDLYSTRDLQLHIFSQKFFTEVRERERERWRQGTPNYHYLTLYVYQLMESGGGEMLCWECSVYRKLHWAWGYIFSFVTTENTHGVVMATFWRTFHHDGTIIPAWCGWRGAQHTLHPFTILYLPSRTKLWCMLHLRGQIHSPYLYVLYPYMYSVFVTTQS